MINRISALQSADSGVGMICTVMELFIFLCWSLLVVAAALGKKEDGQDYHDRTILILYYD